MIRLEVLSFLHYVSLVSALVILFLLIRHYWRGD